MTPLKAKCSICGKEESNQDLIKEVSEIIKKYNLKAEHYLNLLNLMNGKCLNSDEHSFLLLEIKLMELRSKEISNEQSLKNLDVKFL